MEMRNVCDDENTRIISAKNVNKKLSFQGWEKCVEVFSQGKGNLSHRCSQLMPDMETSTLDQTISWSSSEEELAEKPPLSIRSRRTLLSRINFGDCKRVRRGRRRHSSAQFVRSVEKSTHSSATISSSHFIPDSFENSKLSDTPVDKAQQKDVSLTDCQPFDEHMWDDNPSILNKRVNIAADCSLESTLSHHLNDSDLDLPSVINFEKKVETSPILATRSARKRRSIKEKSESIKHASMSQNVIHTPSASSPILKPSHFRRKSGLKTSKYPPPEGEDGATAGSVTKIEVDKGNMNSIKTSNSTGTAAKPVFLSPPYQKNDTESVVSPVIGTSSKRRRKPVSMPVDSSISPILGSKTKSARHPKVQTILTSPNMPQNNEEHRFSKEDSESGSSIPDIDKLIQFLDKDIDQCKKEHTPLKASAKRSLHFSPQTKCDKNESYLYANVVKNSATADCGMENGQTWNENESRPAEMDQDLNQSKIIEEINTEQMDVSGFLSKTVDVPCHVQKKTKLSLQRNLKINCSNIKMSNRKPIYDALVNCNDPSAADTSNATCQTVCKGDKQKKISKSCGKYKKEEVEHPKVSADLKTSSNDTLFIEEESSEPMSLPSDNIFVSPHQLSNKPQTKSLTDIRKSFKSGSGNEKWKKNIDGDIDIDSYSSQSSGKLKGSQSDQIERLVSPCLSSPMTISQLSSPPAPRDGLQVERRKDDFNAPPGKGKKKLKSDGLANRLQRLLNRQRSSSRIWQFKRSKQNKTESSPALNPLRNSSMLLVVEHTWTEYSHVLVQGYVADENARACLDSSSSGRTIVVIDPNVAEKLGKILSSTQIRIFPPWQALKIRGFTLILCAYCIEVVCSDVTDLMSQRNTLEEILFMKDGLECSSGMNITDIIFPKFEERHIRLFQCTEDNISPFGMQSDVLACESTISTFVSNHYAGKTVSSSLSLTVFEAFRYKQDGGNKSKADTCWSILAQDSAGEVCEVVLGSEETSSPRRGVWEDLNSGNAIGNTYVFSGFGPIQRISPFRVSNSWRVTSNMDIPGVSDQLVFYLLGAVTFSWSCEFSGQAQKLCVKKPQFSHLSNVVPKVPFAEPKRSNIICRMLHVSPERLYIIDKSIFPEIKVVTLNSNVDVPPNIFKMSLLAIFHLEVDAAGELRADKYSRILPVDRNLSNNLYERKELEDLANITVTLPPLLKTSVAKTLVTFIGTIVGVDEDSAFMWPACGVCENELLSLGHNPERYSCEKCNNQCENFTLRMSLQVLTTSPNLPTQSSVRLKLIQTTIESLLPQTPCNEEGYDMNAILDRKLGPVECEILHVKDNNFTLQELPGLTPYTYNFLR